MRSFIAQQLYDATYCYVDFRCIQRTDGESKPAEEIHVDSCGIAETMRPRRERTLRTRRLSAEPAESEVYFRSGIQAL